MRDLNYSFALFIEFHTKGSSGVLLAEWMDCDALQVNRGAAWCYRAASDRGQTIVAGRST